MFQFPGFASPFREMTGWAGRVAPFGYPRIKGYLLLPVAFRSLSRPSSPPRAQASFMCPSLLSFGPSFFNRLNITAGSLSELLFRNRGLGHMFPRRASLRSRPDPAEDFGRSRGSPSVFLDLDLLVLVVSCFDVFRSAFRRDPSVDGRSRGSPLFGAALRRRGFIFASRMSMSSFFEWRITDSNR